MSTADEDDEFQSLRKEEGNSILRLFMEYGRGQRLMFAIGGVASILSIAMELVPALVLGTAIDSLFFDTTPFDLHFVPGSFIPATQEGQFVLAAAALGGAHVLGAVLGWVNSYAWNHFSQHFQHNVRTDSYDAMQRRELGFFDNRQTGEVMSILNNDVNQLEGFLTNSLNTGLQIVVRVGGMGVVMLLLNWKLALAPVVVIPALALLSYKFVQAIHPKYQDVRSAVGKMNSRLENNLGGIEVVKSFTGEEFETDRVEDSSREYLDAQWDAITTRILFWPALRITTAVGYLTTFVIGGWWVMTGSAPVFSGFFSGSLTAGMLVIFLSYTRRFMWPMRQFGRIINDYQYAQAAGERIVGLLDTEPDIAEEDDAVVLDDVEGRVEYEDVTFEYVDEDGDEEEVLHDVSFEVDPGDYVGLVGPTGAGKTTLLKLLMRFYDVQEGEVRLDGHDVRDISLRSLRENIGYVSQEPYLFYGTVRENIAYGRPDVTDEEIERVSRMAGAHEFVSNLDDGYDTKVGERGVKLSGGQRQRVSIARALLKDPEVLVLDEATSHVDNETEVLIQNSLEELVADRTTFAIAHRLSTVRDADQILVMDEGEIVERGTHEELLAEEGLYANLWSVQVGEVEDLPEEFVRRTAKRQAQIDDD